MGLQQYREQIDVIDNELLRLFKERMSVARQIALYKKEHNLPALDAAREVEKLAVIDEKAGVELRPYARKLYALLFELSRAYQDVVLD
jgi:chorismate mutase/prephenate dehydratase